jgi:hypothetical protein
MLYKSAKIYEMIEERIKELSLERNRSGRDNSEPSR